MTQKSGGMRIALTGGGTGGHIYPALAVAAAIRRQWPDAELLYLGSGAAMEARIVPQHGIAFQEIPARKLRKLVSLSTIAAAATMVRGTLVARRYLRAFSVDAVLGTGGYVGAATVAAGARLGAACTIIEGNVLAGRTNRWLARLTKAVCTAWDETSLQFRPGLAIRTGLPVRADVVLPAAVRPAAARLDLVQQLGAPPLARNRFTVLALGGSQGSRGLNVPVCTAVPALLDEGCQVIHQTGEANLEAVRRAAAERGYLDSPWYLPTAWLSDISMASALRNADLVVCRGGISTLSEVMANGRPALVVPLPTAYADHQRLNAEAFERAGGAVAMLESGLSGTSLAAAVCELAASPGRHAAMCEASRRLSPIQAADLAASIVMQSKP
ncbi:MAG: UDP-N-acetylglucosamine--N-acetylmuramyl-(pentapeptide) pyrophosphoryl-undecaprenol N-acetylglucosamine transferase [Armatimonadetes bacterium]|nr:UDP-N-acetylglucosamine--N-acetylmuramyl-(pentapeptide) pyrophosphoryl-undecaprenol N-acetylglucosamine transferase [Armatimonadota bacterium]MDE2205219.1 UDP-N-acetylglucosamine--N-acetylmuramyl-(pentapeptide) pyrophosphoryl-undecaprenol N-acetylglucosamine transferase [Armatimonadota bacterium]